ncbi:hypothetical protein ASF10_14965 [Flavobacterium sp. Leaf82]|nr:hypothetical protein ASF10_14965 [Flavobacterium sp. Leaf82]
MLRLKNTKFAKLVQYLALRTLRLYKIFKSKNFACFAVKYIRFRFEMRILPQSALRFLFHVTFKKHKVRKAGSTLSFANFAFV